MDLGEHVIIVFLISSFFFYLGYMVGRRDEHTKWAHNLGEAVRNTRPR